MDNCIFCEILAGRAPASMVYRDGRVAVFMDNHPVNPGHMLVVPVRHARLVAEMDEETGMHLFRIGMRMDRALRESGLRCEAVRLEIRDGRAAGQVVPHVHLHVMPRYLGEPGPSRAGRAEMEDAAERIRRAYQRLYE